MKWTESSVVVTGGAGFIGSHLVDRLLASGAGHVRVIDDFSRGSMANLLDANETGRLRIQRTNLQVTRAAMWNTTVVFHLAAKVTGIEYNRHHHFDMMATNLAINQNVIESVARAQPRLFVYVSTACVYPHDAPVPTPEDAALVCNPEPTNHGYGVAKWTGEQLTRRLHQELGIPSIIVRFFNAFGPRDYYDQATSHVAPALIRRVVEGDNPVTVWGTGNQTRALVDARDIAKALGLLVERALEDVQFLCLSREPWIVNIGHEREISIRELAGLILQKAGGTGDPVLAFDESKPDGYPRRAAETTRLRSLTGWVPNTPAHVTIEDMIADYRSRRDQILEGDPAGGA